MRVDQVAALAVEWFREYNYPDPATAPINRERAILMTAIAGGESAYNELAMGDRGLNPTFHCNDYCSFGLWQVYIPVHQELIKRLMNRDIVTPCEQGSWLMVGENNARAARDIFASQGYSAWSVYNTGAHYSYLGEATRAVDAYIATLDPKDMNPDGPEQLAAAVTLAQWLSAGWDMNDINERQREVLRWIVEKRLPA